MEGRTGPAGSQLEVLAKFVWPAQLNAADTRQASMVQGRERVFIA
jgi:hypothetical protein